ncbi:hypothetical protein RCCGEPOP_27539 [Rhizobium sp. Pop5]|nr:hypothetical protein RCCGEPOP_27539 [Rhizobium sp. Pop5]
MGATISLGGDSVNAPRMLPRPAVFRLRCAKDSINRGRPAMLHPATVVHKADAAALAAHQAFIETKYAGVPDALSDAGGE